MSVDLVGHAAIREHLSRVAASGRLPHAMLFAGPEGVGKRTLALDIARRLVAGDDAGDAARFDRGAHDRFALFVDVDAPWAVRRRDLLRDGLSEDALLEAYAVLEDEGWIQGVAPGRGPDVVDLIRRNPEKLLGRRGIPFADVLEKELAALERSRRSAPGAVGVARALFSAGTSRAFYRRSLGIELVNGKGDGEYFRTIASLLSLSAGGGWRVAVVDDAHKMTDPAQNAFLKTLEEPPPSTLLVLVTSDPDVLLSTIRSRCARVVFDALPPAAVERFLAETQGVAREEAAALAALSGGSIGRALRLRGVDVSERRRFAETLLAAIADGALLRALAVTGTRLSESGAEGSDGRDARRDEARLLLDLLALGLRDLALGAGAGAEPISGLDRSVLRALAPRRRPEVWEALLERTDVATRDLAASVEPRFAVEALLAEAVPGGSGE
jgi:DNA polymerase III delta prime subunit